MAPVIILEKPSFTYSMCKRPIRGQRALVCFHSGPSTFPRCSRPSLWSKFVLFQGPRTTMHSSRKRIYKMKFEERTNHQLKLLELATRFELYYLHSHLSQYLSPLHPTSSSPVSATSSSSTRAKQLNRLPMCPRSASSLWAVVSLALL